MSDARSLLNEAEERLAILKSQGEPAPLAWALLYLVNANLARNLGNYPEAQTKATLAVQMCRQAGPDGSDYLFTLLLQLGDIAYKNKDSKTARQQWQELIAICDQIPYADNHLRNHYPPAAYERLARASAQLGQRKEALSFAQRAHQLYAQNDLLQKCERVEKLIDQIKTGKNLKSLFD